MLRWQMCSATRMNKIRNGYIRRGLGVIHDEENKKEQMRWFGYVKRKNNNNIVKKISEIIIKKN